MADPKDQEGSERSSREARRSREEGDDVTGAEGSRAKDAPEEVDDERRAFRRFSEGLIANLLGDSGAAIRRGQGLVTGVAQGTKDELTRLISVEVRNFLEKIDAVDLVQQVVSGLVIEMKTEIRFTRAEDGKLVSKVETPEVKIRSDE